MADSKTTKPAKPKLPSPRVGKPKLPTPKAITAPAAAAKVSEATAKLAAKPVVKAEAKKAIKPKVASNGRVARHLLHEVVKWQLAKKRQGTAKTKQRNEVAGSTRKIYRQKGTGRARHGSSKAPIFVGGGQTFGPIPRSYDYALPRKVKRKGLQTALEMKQQSQQVKVVDSLQLAAGKTKLALKELTPHAFATALVVDMENENLLRGVRNLRNYKFLRPEGLNVYDLLKYDGLIITAPALKKVQEGLQP